MSRRSAIDELHKQGISATMASVICGVNPWESPYTLYQRLKGEVEPKEQTDAMWFGTVMEPVVMRFFTRKTKLKVRRPRKKIDPQFLFRSEEYGYPMMALLDGLTYDDDGEAGVEAKTANVFAAREWAEEIPLHYWFQVQHQMAAASLDRIYVAAVVGNQLLLDPKTDWPYRVDRDEEIIALITDKERAFWHQHLVPGVPPPLDGHEATTKLMRSRYQRAEPETTIVIEDPEVERLCQVALAHKDSIDRLEDERDAVLNQLRALLDTNERAEAGSYRILFKEKAGRSSINAKRLRADYPELAAEYTVTGEPSRPLIVSRKKDS